MVCESHITSRFKLLTYLFLLLSPSPPLNFAMDNNIFYFFISSTTFWKNSPSGHVGIPNGYVSLEEDGEAVRLAHWNLKYGNLQDGLLEGNFFHY